MCDVSMGAELRSLHNMIKRFVYNTINEKYGDKLQGTNGFIISWLAEHQNDEVYQKDVEKAFSITRSTASKMISLMEDRGLVIRQEAEHDARLKRISLTPEALSLFKAITEDINFIEQSLIHGLTAEDQEHMLQCLNIMKGNVERLSAGKFDFGGNDK